MAWRSVISGTEIDNIREDRRASVGIEQYKISKEAIYMKGEYLPISAISEVMIRPSTYTPSCACGKGLPVFKIRLDYGAEKPLILMVEKEKNVEKLLAMITASRPDIKVETL